MKRPPGAAILLATALLAACASGPPPQATPSLDGRTFLSTNVEGKVLVQGTRIQLAFQGGGLSASAGCNTMGGAYRIEGGRLVVDQLSSTEMACEPPLMEQDRWLADLLTIGSAISLGGDILRLESSQVRVTLLDREVADPDRPLEGTRWVLDSVIDGGAVMSVVPGIEATISISGGRVAVEAGCNTGGAPVEIGEATLTFGELVLTEQLCGPGEMAIERAVVAALSGTVGFAIEANVLTLDAGGHGLIFRATL